ncbi:MAG: hypothetical protein OEW23_19510, partial [Candidatus Aminicenantes bacterium]|nr:hypothetical protein [Candidatus Aminicenantes bacterium]
MKMKSCLKGIGLWVAALTLILSPMLVYADCEIVPTTDGGYIIDCIGIIDGVDSGNGNDRITVMTTAEVRKIDQQSLDSIAITNAIAIDAGSGNNQVTNNGSIGATADANALPVDGSASQATANVAGISAGDGEDVI